MKDHSHPLSNYDNHLGTLTRSESRDAPDRELQHGANVDRAITRSPLTSMRFLDTPNTKRLK